MTIKYKNVYIDNFSTVVGPYEAKGPLKNSFDKSYDDLYINTDTWEKAEYKLLDESIRILLEKTKLDSKDIDLIVSGDLSNQISASCYGVLNYDIPFLGVYSACATNVESISVASTFIDSGRASKCIVSTCSHNMSSEKQFRNPTEYGAPKPSTATFTSTGGASLLLTNKKTDIKVVASTIGKVIDMDQNDPLNMGAVMAGAAADTINKHMRDLNLSVEDYDLILTGDLGKCGKKILSDYMSEEYNINLSDNYNDTGTMLYDFDKQKEVLSGGSGPVCSALVCYSYVLPLMRKKKLKRVLIAATGALFSPTFVFQHQNINSICHAVTLEVV